MPDQLPSSDDARRRATIREFRIVRRSGQRVARRPIRATTTCKDCLQVRRNVAGTGLTPANMGTCVSRNSPIRGDAKKSRMGATLDQDRIANTGSL